MTEAIGAEPHGELIGRLTGGTGIVLECCPPRQVELRIPKVREGASFPSLLEPRRRVDRALRAVVMTAYVTGTIEFPYAFADVRALGVSSGYATYLNGGKDHRFSLRGRCRSPGVTADGKPRSPRQNVGDTEDEVFSTTFLRPSCVVSESEASPRVVLVISDAHTGAESSDP